ncbi:MAG: phosphopantetheine-binding protein [Syntrophales bacterium]|jgi:acyl carrier protein|nr:phosphopantetheine-binding protein [Syntrophales bacterium]
MNQLIIELKQKIIETLNLLDVSPEDIDENGQLIGGDLGLDSIDVLELVMMLEKDYGIEIDSKELGVKVFASVAALADHVYHHRTKNNAGAGGLTAPVFA